MALAVFNPEVGPSPGTQRAPTVSLNKAAFGDGYIQASPKGLNHIRRTLSLKWNGLTNAQLAALELFMVNHGGYKPFFYTHALDGVQRRWTCSEWSAGFTSPPTFSCTLQEDFTNVT